MSKRPAEPTGEESEDSVKKNKVICHTPEHDTEQTSLTYLKFVRGGMTSHETNEHWTFQPQYHSLGRGEIANLQSVKYTFENTVSKTYDVIIDPFTIEKKNQSMSYCENAKDTIEEVVKHLPSIVQRKTNELKKTDRGSMQKNENYLSEEQEELLTTYSKLYKCVSQGLMLSRYCITNEDQALSRARLHVEQYLKTEERDSIISTNPEYAVFMRKAMLAHRTNMANGHAKEFLSKICDLSIKIRDMDEECVQHPVTEAVTVCDGHTEYIFQKSTPRKTSLGTSGRHRSETMDKDSDQSSDQSSELSRNSPVRCRTNMDCIVNSSVMSDVVVVQRDEHLSLDSRIVFMVKCSSRDDHVKTIQETVMEAREQALSCLWKYPEMVVFIVQEKHFNIISAIRNDTNATISFTETGWINMKYDLEEVDVIFEYLVLSMVNLIRNAKNVNEIKYC